MSLEETNTARLGRFRAEDGAAYLTALNTADETVAVSLPAQHATALALRAGGQ